MEAIHTMTASLRSIDSLHNYGPGARLGASPVRISCDVCLSRLSFRFSSVSEVPFSYHIVFLAIPIETGLVLHYSLIVLNSATVK